MVHGPHDPCLRLTRTALPTRCYAGPGQADQGALAQAAALLGGLERDAAGNPALARLLAAC